MDILLSRLLLMALVSCVSSEDKLNMCMDGKHQISEPQPEGQLYQQCEPWRDSACCTANTTEEAHEDNSYLYNFNWNHCGIMSDRCKKHFIQDTCFYECSPHLGPWIQPAEESWRKERILDVPLCLEDCESWYEDCKDDLTCKDNWHKGWDWSTGTNHCPDDAPCSPWADIFPNAQSMCEKIWSNSYKYTTLSKDSGRCMQMWFQPPNPNKKVAEYYLSGDAKTVAMATGLHAFACLLTLLLCNLPE
ncbi:folate receptor [Xyrauchen texanus]|uniref:folate receptor n=1 Tax=Xyrauchen texanus TaxID=154827 RepID=UPI002241CAF8|nr:folate receptor [Xyrauchen texanus]